MKLAREVGITVHLVHGGEVRPDDASDMLMSTILNAVAVMEAANTRRRVNRELSDRRKEGRYLGGGRAFGHNADRTKVEPDEQALLEEAADRVLTGESVGSIVRDWIERDVRTVTGKHFSVTTFTQLLRQPRLAGLHEPEGNKYTRRADGTAGKYLEEAAWPLLLDRETWEAVVAALSAHTGKRPPNRRHLLGGGYLRCAECNTPMHGSWHTQNGKRRAIYRCPPSTQVEGACGGVSIDGAQTDAYVMDQVFAYLDSQRFERDVQRALKASGRGEIAKLSHQLERKRARLRDIERMFEDDELDPAAFKRMRGNVQGDIDQLEAQLDDMTDVPPVHLIGQGEELRRDFDSMSFTEKREVLAYVLDGVHAYRSGRGVRWSRERLTDPREWWRW
jgi:hypothetical protein